MEFSIDGTLGRLRDDGRKLGATMVASSAAQRHQRGHWDAGLFAALATAGLASPLLPSDQGGLGLNVLETVAILEGFGAGGLDPGLAFGLGVHGVLGGGSV